MSPQCSSICSKGATSHVTIPFTSMFRYCWSYIPLFVKYPSLYIGRLPLKIVDVQAVSRLPLLVDTNYGSRLNCKRTKPDFCRSKEKSDINFVSINVKIKVSRCWKMRTDQPLNASETSRRVEASEHHQLSNPQRNNHNMALLVDKHRPRNLEALNYHPELSERLRALVRILCRCA